MTDTCMFTFNFNIKTDNKNKKTKRNNSNDGGKKYHNTIKKNISITANCGLNVKIVLDVCLF